MPWPRRFSLPALLACLLALTLAGALAWAQEQPSPEQPAEELVLILDSPDYPGLPRHFRAASDSLPSHLADPPSLAGLAELRVSGSAQFSRPQLADLLAVLPRAARALYVVDLRQESHGLISGRAVSWYGPRDWANQGKTLEEVEADESARLEAAQAAGQVTVTRVLAKDDQDRIAQAETFTLTVTSVQSQAQLMALNDLGYLRLPVTDHLRPGDRQVEAFLQFWASLPAGAWLHFHCHAGDGRTTTFMLMADILANAHQVSLADLARRQHLLGGMDLLDSPPDTWKRAAYLERAEFIGRFYLFARAQEPGRTGSWLAWVGADTASPGQGPDQDPGR